MIDWSKPILVGGVPETFKLAGTLNDKQLVVTTDSNGTQSLFVVDEAGDSYLLNCGYPTRPPRGPKFENEPLPPKTYKRFINIYKDGRLSGMYNSLESAVRGVNPDRVEATVCITFTVESPSFIYGAASRA